MPKSYRKANEKIHELYQEILEKYHPQIAAQTPRADLIEVWEFGEKPAILHNGQAAYARIKILSLKDRSMGRGDFEIEFDAETIEDWEDDQIRALIDHEVTHLEQKRNKDGQLVVDDLGRPCFGMRKHDIEVGWFSVTAKRWGKDSVESDQARNLFNDPEFRKTYLDCPHRKDMNLEETEREIEIGKLVGEQKEEMESDPTTEI